MAASRATSLRSAATSSKIKILIDMIKNAQQRGFTAGLLPYGFHADTPPDERTFVIMGEPDFDKSRKGDLKNIAMRSLTQERLEKKTPLGIAKEQDRVDSGDFPMRRVIIATNAAETAVTFEIVGRWLIRVWSIRWQKTTLQSHVQNRLPSNEVEEPEE